MMLTYFFAGGCRLWTERCNTEAVLNICMKHRLVYRQITFSEDGERVSLSCTLYTADLLQEACSRSGIELRCDRRWGLPIIFTKYRHRYGIAIGALLAAAVVLFSRSFLWDVRVSGHSSVSTEQIKSQLAEQGLSVGMLLSGADIDRIENRLVLASDEISWVAINLDGVVAYVEVRERLPVPSEQSKLPANLVAETDGRIESVEAYDGNPMVKIGEYVSRGQLLVSGVYDSNVEGYRYTRARGEVWARTVSIFQIEIPLFFEEKQFTGETKVQNSLIFFGNRIKLYKNSGFLGTTYDTISRVDNYALWNGAVLPVSIVHDEHRVYENVPSTRTPEQAKKLAYERLEEILDEYSDAGARLLDSKTEGKLGADSYTLECTLTLVENIAKTVEFEAE